MRLCFEIMGGISMFLICWSFIVLMSYLISHSMSNSTSDLQLKHRCVNLCDWEYPMTIGYAHQCMIDCMDGKL